MSLHIEQRENEGIAILDLKGPLAPGPGDLELRDLLPAIAFPLFDDEQDAVNSFFPDGAIHHFDVLDFVKGAVRAARESPTRQEAAC